MKEHFNKTEPISVIIKFLQLGIICESDFFVCFFFLMKAMQAFKGKNKQNIAIDSFKMP